MNFERSARDAREIFYTTGWQTASAGQKGNTRGKKTTRSTIKKKKLYTCVPVVQWD